MEQLLRRDHFEEAAQIVERWANAKSGELRLRAGEMTAQEIRTVRAVLKAVAFDLRGRKPR